MTAVVTLMPDTVTVLCATFLAVDDILRARTVNRQWKHITLRISQYGRFDVQHISLVDGLRLLELENVVDSAQPAPLPRRTEAIGHWRVTITPGIVTRVSRALPSVRRLTFVEGPSSSQSEPTQGWLLTGQVA